MLITFSGQPQNAKFPAEKEGKQRSILAARLEREAAIRAETRAKVEVQAA